MKCPSEEEIKQAIQVWENKVWEFKDKDSIGHPKLMASNIVDEKDWELCRDIASFANTIGGHIIIGVQDDRKDRKIQGFSIDDRLKTRLSKVVRSRISPVPLYNIDTVKVGAKHVTAISIDEGDADMCTVNGTVFIRDINGRAMATGAEITRIVKRRLGKKLNPAPTDREIIDSPYNLPVTDARVQAILADFERVAPSYGFKVFRTTLQMPYSRTEYVWTQLGIRTRQWSFLVIALGGNFGPDEYRYTYRYTTWLLDKREILKQLGLPDNADVHPLILIMGRINSLKSRLIYLGLSFVPTRFGGYVGRGDRKPRYYSDTMHWFMLSGITSPGAMDTRIDSFVKWLESNQSKLSKARKSLRP